MTSPQTVPQTTQEEQVFRHRPGWSEVELYYSCDYETYRRLRDINYWICQLDHRLAAYQRWVRKAPHNRVIRTYSRNEQGQRTGVMTTRPLSPPTLPRHIFPLSQGRFNDLGLRRLYNECRMPSTTPKQPLPVMTIAMIEQFHTLLETWFTHANGTA